LRQQLGHAVDPHGKIDDSAPVQERTVSHIEAHTTLIDAEDKGDLGLVVGQHEGRVYHHLEGLLLGHSNLAGAAVITTAGFSHSNEQAKDNNQGQRLHGMERWFPAGKMLVTTGSIDGKGRGKGEQ